MNNPPLSGALTILACYDGPFDDVCFSINVFCGSGITMNWDDSAGVGGIGVKGHSMKVRHRPATGGDSSDIVPCRSMAPSLSRMRGGTTLIQHTCSTHNGICVYLSKSP